jgi:hypothetical protein
MFQSEEYSELTTQSKQKEIQQIIIQNLDNADLKTIQAKLQQINVKIDNKKLSWKTLGLECFALKILAPAYT